MYEFFITAFQIYSAIGVIFGAFVFLVRATDPHRDSDMSVDFLIAVVFGATWIYGVFLLFFMGAKHGPKV